MHTRYNDTTRRWEYLAKNNVDVDTWFRLDLGHTMINGPLFIGHTPNSASGPVVGPAHGSGDLAIARNNDPKSGALYFGTNLDSYIFRGTDGTFTYQSAGGLHNIVGSLLNTGNLSATGTISAGGAIYPGNIAGGVQSSWYFLGHSTYGLYTNTGLYLENAIWPNYIEARNHIRAAGGLYDYTRGVPIGDWTAAAVSGYNDASQTITVVAGYGNSYTLIGHTMFWKGQLVITIPSASTNIYLNTPLGYVPTGNQSVQPVWTYQSGVDHIGVAYYDGSARMAIRKTNGTQFAATAQISLGWQTYFQF